MLQITIYPSRARVWSIRLRCAEEKPTNLRKKVSRSKARYGSGKRVVGACLSSRIRGSPQCDRRWLFLSRSLDSLLPAVRRHIRKYQDRSRRLRVSVLARFVYRIRTGIGFRKLHLEVVLTIFHRVPYPFKRPIGLSRSTQAASSSGFSK